MNELDRCVCCGNLIPEGRQVCPICEFAPCQASPEENKYEMIPVEQWDGECWKTFFDDFCVPAGERYGVSPWEYLASFIKQVVIGETNP